jgi:hypothetical protein
MDDFAAQLRWARSICLALPDAFEEEAWVGTRWKVRSNTFAHLVEILGGHPASFAAAAGISGPAVVLTLRCPWAELDAVLGRPGVFGPLWNRSDVGIRLAEFDDRDELAELLIESYRMRAPARLVRKLDEAADQVRPQRDSAKP